MIACCFVWLCGCVSLRVFVHACGCACTCACVCVCACACACASFIVCHHESSPPCSAPSVRLLPNSIGNITSCRTELDHEKASMWKRKRGRGGTDDVLLLFPSIMHKQRCSKSRRMQIVPVLLCPSVAAAFSIPRHHDCEPAAADAAREVGNGAN